MNPGALPAAPECASSFTAAITCGAAKTEGRNLTNAKSFGSEVANSTVSK
jgi:hypothetical protein